jgi:DNA-binding MarR family transcriptional regulator
VLSGQKNFSAENICELAIATSLNEIETDFLFLLHELDRAGTPALRSRLQEKINKARKSARDLSQKVKKNLEMSLEAQSVYYSSWLFSAVRNSSNLVEFRTVESLSKKLGVSSEAITRVVNFLVENGLMEKDGSALFSRGRLTHLGATSPLSIKHHHNWRLRGMKQMDNFNSEDFFLTFPMSLSHKHAELLRRELPALIEKISNRLGTENAEENRCLNIDFFGF